jgi:hypothetical protein
MSRKLTSLLIGALAFCACHSLTPAQEARLALFECRAAALAPVVGDVLDAEALIRDVYVGRASLSSALSSLNATPEEIAKVVSALGACDGNPEPSATASGESTL